jgi:PBSX family phage terminase large subunit
MNSHNEAASRQTKKLTDLIAPSFYPVHQVIKRREQRHIWLAGGRGSTKSSFVAVELMLALERDPEASAVILRKVGDTLRDSVYEQIKWAIHQLNLSGRWRTKVNPLEIVNLLTGQKILFRSSNSMEDREKIKSIKVATGAIKFCWFEELHQFDGMEEIRSILQSLIRGTDESVVFYSYNPPKSSSAWVNAESHVAKPGYLVHRSTYLTVPAKWLGSTFIAEAEALKMANLSAYEHEYLGSETGTGGEVFANVTTRQITNKEIKNFEYIKRGCDFGFANDPAAYGTMHYDRKHKKLYVFHEVYGLGITNDRLAEHIKKENKDNEAVTCDSAEPKSLAELRRFGVKVIGARKGKDSVRYGVRFLQSLNEIIIDNVRCPNTAREFTTYELERDSHGNFKDGYPDKDNHSIDMVRYAMNKECLAYRDNAKDKKADTKKKSNLQADLVAMGASGSDDMSAYTRW